MLFTWFAINNNNMYWLHCIPNFKNGYMLGLYAKKEEKKRLLLP